MSREKTILAALTAEWVSTSELYDRVGYLALVRIGLVPYPEFRAELEKLATAGLAQSETGDDGATMWRSSDTGEASAGDASPASSR